MKVTTDNVNNNKTAKFFMFFHMTLLINTSVNRTKLKAMAAILEQGPVNILKIRVESICSALVRREHESELD